jgi:glycosyltransferase involved in cell wall biosynthesis
MRIVIDLQGAQSSGSRHRGIGRYTMWLAQAMVRNRRNHEIFIALNGLFPDSIEQIRAEFAELLPQENVRVWYSPGPVSHLDPANTWRRRCAEFSREAFLASFQPDFVLISSLFEGPGDDSVGTIGLLTRSVPTATILYDLIPLIYRHRYLENPAIEAWYLRKLDNLRRTSLALAISDSSRDEAIRLVGLSANDCVSISTATDPLFAPQAISPAREAKVRRAFALEKPFVMYTGGIDYRKNIEGLIRAYARLSSDLRAQHQLAIVCSIHQPERERLNRLAKEAGLESNEVMMTGYVSEEDLLALYNLCKLFVFPSWHEGFGLPALEAMACGRAVIGSNTSSIPEVIDRKDALFDPHSDRSISEAIDRVLTNNSLRTELESHGLVQSKKFSWDISARRALEAMEGRLASLQAARPALAFSRRPKLAFVSPLPPERSGISDYSAELIPELARYYEIEVIVAQATVADPWITANYPIRNVEWFKTNASTFDRVLYHFGNSSFHQHMFGLLDEAPGVVVLHDFFLSGIISNMDVHGYAPHIWSTHLYQSHGYAALHERFAGRKLADFAATIDRYPANLAVLKAASGVIVHSEESLRLAQKWFGSDAGKDWAVIPLLRTPRIIDGDSKVAARERLGIPPTEIVICSFGKVGQTKLSQRVLKSWLESRIADSPSCRLIFVGENDPTPYGQQLETLAQESIARRRILITGWVDRPTFQDWLTVADLCVQLRTLSRGETSAAVLDCMNYGVATIVNSNGSLADLPTDAVHKLPDEFDDSELSRALDALAEDATKRETLGRRAQEIVHRLHSPRVCAEQYFSSIEDFYRRTTPFSSNIADAIASVEPIPSGDTAWQSLSEAIAQNIPIKPLVRQLLVDVSNLAVNGPDDGAHVEARNILAHWLVNPPQGIRVEPVYANSENEGLSYRYARRFALRLIGCPENVLDDDVVEFHQGDVFLALDSAVGDQAWHRSYYQALRRRGVEVHFVVYDLQPVLMPDLFEHGATSGLQQWLSVLAEGDGAVCISRAVADELINWLQVHGPQRVRPLSVNWFHPGAEQVLPAKISKSPEGVSAVLDTLAERPTFLMIGTLEPRKGHSQVLAAFKLLWERGEDANLVIVGKSHALSQNLINEIRNQSQLGRRLFWLEGITDDYLNQIYAASTCLLTASLGEGFSPTLIDSGRFGLPILARDLPVFREFAGDNATFFSGLSPNELTDALSGWLAAYRRGEILSTSAIHALTWSESAQALLDAVLQSKPYRQWLSDGVQRFWGSDKRLHTQVGKRLWQSIVSDGTAGFLTYGPYIALAPGSYEVIVRGERGLARNIAATIDVAVEKGENHLCKGILRDEVEGTDLLAAMQFTLHKHCTDLEVRIWVDEGSTLSISRLEIAPLTHIDAAEPMKLIPDAATEESVIDPDPTAAHVSGGRRPPLTTFTRARRAKHR